VYSILGFIMTVSYLILNDLLQDVQRANASPTELDGVFFSVFKDVARPCEGAALREQQDNAIIHHKILTTVSGHPNWEAQLSFQKCMMWALHMPNDEGILNKTTRNALADVMRLLPTDVLLKVVELEHQALTHHGLAALPVVVKARLNKSISTDSAPAASNKII
jgi:hypothetical protein